MATVPAAEGIVVELAERTGWGCARPPAELPGIGDRGPRRVQSGTIRDMEPSRIAGFSALSGRDFECIRGLVPAVERASR